MSSRTLIATLVVTLLGIGVVYALSVPAITTEATQPAAKAACCCGPDCDCADCDCQCDTGDCDCTSCCDDSSCDCGDAEARAAADCGDKACCSETAAEEA